MRLGRRVFGRLHNQIVLPLLAASVVVAVLATFIAIQVVAQPIEKRAQSDVVAAGVHARRSFQQTGDRMARYAKLVAGDRALVDAVTRDGLEEGSQRLLIGDLTRLGVDQIILLDAEGRVVRSFGGGFKEGHDLGQLPLVRRGRIEMNDSDVIVTPEGDVIAGIEPIRTAEGVVGLLITASRLTDAYLAEEVTPTRDTYLVEYDSDGRIVAKKMPADLECVLPLVTPSKDLTVKVLGQEDPLVRKITCPQGTFYVSYTGINQTRNPGLIVSMQSAAEIARVQTYTAGLIALWSLVAVSFLVLLGIFVAQNVSRPVAELASVARRVAEGDLSPAIEIGQASDELLDLANSFRQMTDGLREQNEVLTKRFLELSTLYEMSKAVGATLDVRHLLDTVLDSALKVLGADVGYVMLVDPETGKLVLKAWRAPADVLIEEEALSNSIGSWVLKEGKPLVFGQRPGARPALELGTVRTRAALCVPMRSKAAVNGVITVAMLESESDISQQNVNLLVTIANQAAIALDNAELFDSLQQAYLATVRALAAAVDAKDPYTHGHSGQVARYAMLLAGELGLADEERDALETAAYLHDIGKIGVKDEILLKPGRLDAEEMSFIRHHPLIGANILAPVPFPWPIIPTVRHHHERWDGTGYPAGLVGEEIPKLARILSVADAFEAMTSDRPYRKGHSFDEAAVELRRCSGTQFDPNMVEPFLTAVEREESTADEARVLAFPQAEWFDEAEVEAVFISVADGLLASLRRLGGPRVAANFQQQMNAHFKERGLPVMFDNGHLKARFGGSMSTAQAVAVFKDVLQAELYAVERHAGAGIAEHFMTDAIDGLPSRHRHLATHFGFDHVEETGA